MADDHTRLLDLDVRTTARAPRLDRIPAVRRHLDRRVCPAVDQLALQLARFRSQRPVGAFTLDVIAQPAQNPIGGIRGVRPERGAESLVGSLMPVHEIANLGVLRFVRTEVDAAVVAQREQQRGAGFAAVLRESAQPILRHEIEQRGCGDDGGVREQRARVRVADRVEIDRPCLDLD